MDNEDNKSILTSCKCHTCLLNGDDVIQNIKPSSVSMSISVKHRGDSGYSSFISQNNTFIRTSSPVVSQTPNIKFDSPSTSFSSRYSSFTNDEELEEMFGGISQKDSEKGTDTCFSRLKDFNFGGEMSMVRPIFRNSPFTVRPESAPLNEEDEDSDKDATEYPASLPQEPSFMSNLPELIQSTLHRYQHPSLMDSDQRNELIASKLREIADKINMSPVKVRTRYSSVSSDITRRSSRRHSSPSFAEIVPCGFGSAVDLILALYNVYRSQYKESTALTVATSPSMANISPSRRGEYIRSRSHTQ